MAEKNTLFCRAIRLFFRLILMILVLGILIAALVNVYVYTVTRGRIVSETDAADRTYDCILVLGAGVWQNNRPSHMLADRLDCGIRLYESGASDRLLMSGDHGREEYDEVNVMKDYAVQAGISSEAVFMDHAGFSTYESLYRARDIFQCKRILIVTQGYHMYRALYIAESLGLDAQGVASDPRAYAGQAMREVREIAARVKDFAMCIVKPLPTYLGDTIPISGNGDATND